MYSSKQYGASLKDLPPFQVVAVHCRIAGGELISVFQALLLLTEGPCILLRGRDNGGALKLREIADKWRRDTSCRGGNNAADNDSFSHVTAVRLADETDLVLLPIPEDAGGSSAPFSSLILGFHVSRGAPWVTKHVIQLSRLPLILDLDETLLIANSPTQLYRKVQEACRRREECSLAVSEATTHQDRELAEEALAAMKAEIRALNQDLAWAKEFAEHDAVTVDGTKQTAVMEDVDGHLTRPVIRRMDKGFILTRINPSAKQTSMLVRIRPGWEELRAFILSHVLSRDPVVQETKLKFEVSVCTAAQRSYALEMWRLLDPGGMLIPLTDQLARIVNVDTNMSCKTLSAACKLGQPVSQEQSVLPMAIIIDDRLDVWEPSARGQIVRVEEFAPYRRALEVQRLSMQMHPASIPWLNLNSVKDRIMVLRSNFYYDLHYVLRAAMANQPGPSTRILAWPRTRSVAEMIQDPFLEAPPHPQSGRFSARRMTGKPDIVIEVPDWLTGAQGNTVSASPQPYTYVPWYARESSGNRLADGAAHTMKRRSQSSGSLAAEMSGGPAGGTSDIVDASERSTGQQQDERLELEVHGEPGKAWQRMRRPSKRAARRAGLEALRAGVDGQQPASSYGNPEVMRQQTGSVEGNQEQGPAESWRGHSQQMARWSTGRRGKARGRRGFRPLGGRHNFNPRGRGRQGGWNRGGRGELDETVFDQIIRLG